MNKKLQNKALYLLAFIGLIGMQTNAQVHKFDGVTSDFGLYNNSTGNQTIQLISTATAGEGDAGIGEDGALEINRDVGEGGANNGKNAGIRYNGVALDLDVIDYIKIRYKNETTSNRLRVLGYGSGNTEVTIPSGDTEYSTYFMDMSAVAAWTGVKTKFSILFRSGTPSTDGAANVYVDEIEFLTAAQYAVNDTTDPVFAAGATATATSITENTGAGQEIFDADATDNMDSDDVLYYALSGADAGDFSIHPGTGKVYLTASPDFEAKTSYTFVITAYDEISNATDAQNSASQTVTLAILNDVSDDGGDNSPPVITSSTTATSLVEVTGIQQLVYTATANDVISNVASFAIGGTDAADFTFNTTTGTVVLNANPNYATKASYSFTITATDDADPANTSAPTTVTLAILNPATTHRFVDFAGAESADEGNVGTINPATNGAVNTTAWNFSNDGDNYSFSDEQVFEGDYSIKYASGTVTTAFHYAGLGGNQPGTYAAGSSLVLGTGTYTLELNVFIVSNPPTSIETPLRENGGHGATQGANNNISWDLSSIAVGDYNKWITLRQSYTVATAFANARYQLKVTHLQIPGAVAATAPASQSVFYLDGFSALSPKASTVDGTWEAGATWGGAKPANGAPKNIDRNITINSDVTSSGNITLTGGSLTVKAGSSLNLTGDLVTNNSLILEAGAQMIINGASTGTATYQRTLTATDNSAAANLEGWFSMSPPVSGEALNTAWADANSLADGSGDGRRGLATYLEDGNSFSYFNGTATTFEAGKGYMVKRNGNGTISFTGTINTANTGIDVTVTNTGMTGDGFNLLGNPYTSQINITTFLNDASNTGKINASQVWVWNDNGNTYTPVLGASNTLISPGQAFFVQVTAVDEDITETKTLNFAESNQSAGGGDTFQKSADTKIRLNVSNGNLKRYAEVYYSNNATKGYDLGYEGEVFGGRPDSFSLYSHLLDGGQNKNYQIQSLPNTGLEAMIVPLGIKVPESSEFTFSLEATNIPSGLKVFLEDRQEGVFTQLDILNSEYKVTLTEASNGTGRFFLHTRSSALSTDDVFLNSINIFKSNNSTLKIAGLKAGQASLSIYNILGKQVMNTTFTASKATESISLPNVATGVYVVQLTTQEGKLNKKIILE